MTNKVFTQSENFKSEYSCAVVRVGELIPVEGSDFLAKTNVFGTQIVVRKDQVKEGDEIPRCDKLKTIAFAFGEAIRMDQGDVDAEMAEGYSEEN